jgi:hypothetical protein
MPACIDAIRGSRSCQNCFIVVFIVINQRKTRLNNGHHPLLLLGFPMTVILQEHKGLAWYRFTAHMYDSSSPFDGAFTPSSEEEESIIERAMRDSESFQTLKSSGGTGAFSKDDHLAVARSGAADLSKQEKSAVIDETRRRSPGKDPASMRPVPLFFGHWSGMNPFRFVKPFFLSKKKKD